MIKHADNMQDKQQGNLCKSNLEHKLLIIAFLLSACFIVNAQEIKETPLPTSTDATTETPIAPEEDLFGGTDFMGGYFIEGIEGVLEGETSTASTGVEVIENPDIYPFIFMLFILLFISGVVTVITL